MTVRNAELEDMKQLGHIMAVSFRTAFADFVSQQTMDACAQEDNCAAMLESIYLEGWAKGIAIPFKDKEGNIYLANPDGSEDLVEFNRKERSYKVIARVAQAGKGRYAYLNK